MKQRCQNPNSAAFAGYGARGITLCAEWQAFLPFLDWALSHGYGEDLEIDRVNADGPYEPENCRWVPQLLNVGRQVLDRSGAYVGDLSGRLAEDEIARTKPQAQPYKLFDGNGLYLIVRPSGGKVWRVKYRRNARERLLTIGNHPSISLSEARELCRVAKAQLRRGRDPAEVKAASKARTSRRRQV